MELNKWRSKIKAFVKGNLNNLFYREYRLNRKVRKHLLPYYNVDSPIAVNEKKRIVLMVDGRKKHGGLADRLRGISTTYKYCQDHCIDFSIYFTSPFLLEQLLIPNEYDWRISSDELSYNPSCSIPVYINSSQYYTKDILFQQKMADKYLSREYKQIHVYTNMYYADNEFGSLFNQLFKPAPALQKMIDEACSHIGGGYIAVTFRFQRLLGDDFKDGGAVASSTEEREELIRKCINKMQELRIMYPEVGKFLVTADSENFIEEVSKLDFVYTLPGTIGHMDDTSANNLSVHMKTFLDFFMLARSKKIILLVTGQMYRSGFSKRAAKLNDVPFEEILF